MKILILRIILRKLQNSKKYSNNKTILRIRILVNTAPGLVFTDILILRIVLFLEFSKNFVESWEIF